MKKLMFKPTSLLLSAILLISCILVPIVAIASDTKNEIVVWNGETKAPAKDPAGGANDYLITTAEELAEKAIRYKTYFGKDGGITLTGGEPLLQAEFVKKLFELCHREGLNTCLDTSGCILNDNVKDLLSVCDRVLLDIKYTSDELYKNHVGCGIEKPMSFLSYLKEKNILY